MNTLANRRFVKMNGLGNEIVIIDLRREPVDSRALDAAEVRAAAGANGAPCDQLMPLFAPQTPGTDAFIRIYNNDGSQAGACGNGMRCVADFLFKDTGKRALTFETTAGLVSCWSTAEPLIVTVDMGAPRFGWRDIPLAKECPDTRAIALQVPSVGQPILHSPSVVSMGNPHAVFWVDDVHAYDLASIGPLLENDPIFPERANISLAAIVAPDHLIVRTWERGAGLTKACGSAACAAAVCAARTGRAGRRATVTLPGGDLAIEWRGSDDHVLMTGPVAYEYEGRFDPALFVGADA
ncbi:MAG: diaminopimelate epimerase [Rhodoplanes sp.]